MTDDARVCELVEQVLYERVTPEEVCARSPELLDEVKSRVAECQNIDVLLEKLFPSEQGMSPLPVISPDSPLPTISGYEVLGVLGRGGIGIIYRVRHLKLNRVSALKMLLSGAYASPVELARFMREARAVAALKHQNIVQIYDVYDLEGRPYFTMELVEGGSLAQKIASMRLNVHRTAELVSTLAKAVHAAHQVGIVHRDLKPGNILLTSDGVPKISDFGLATRFADEPSITGNEARLGTPSYMAPEQITGSAGANSSSVDVHALGAILYEMLAGKPPFQAATALETQRKVTSEEPARPSRLNPKVPRDIDTICLKCLSKSPKDRYESAATLADDLDRFLRLEPITARPVGHFERTGKWLRRRPAIAIAAALAILLVGLAGGIAWWNIMQQARLTSEVDADLKEVGVMDSAGRWSNADQALRRAEARLDVRSAEDLRRRVALARQNLNLAASLDAIRLSRATACALPYYAQRADSDYERIFRDSLNINIGSYERDSVQKVKTSPIRPALLESLDDWACTTADAKRRQWILNVVGESDRDPGGWRDKIRDTSRWDDPKTVLNISTTVPAAEVPVSTLLVIAERLRATAQDSCPFLRRVQEEHPADFYANLALGDMVLIIDAREAGIYYRAALAARPEAGVGYSAVGDSLRAQNRLDEALEYYNKALDQDPNYARAKCDLGATLLDKGRFNEALQTCEDSLRLDPNYAWAHYYLGGALAALGHMDQAAQQYAIIFQQAPNARGIPEAYLSALMQSGGFEEALLVWKVAIQNPAANYDVWTGYPELCLLTDNVPEYYNARSTMLERFGASPLPATMQQLARTCLLLPASREDRAVLERATTLVEKALSATPSTEWDYPYYLFAKALADYRNGRLDDALKIIDGKPWNLMGPCPKLLRAMILSDKGSAPGAMRALDEAIVKFDWRPRKADSRDIWIYHILRREAESKVLHDLPALLSGARQPQDNNERIAILGACQFQGLNQRCAAAFHDALQDEPNLIEARNLNIGFVAACASSALLQARDSHDAVSPGKYDRAQLRQQACEWLTVVLDREKRHPRTTADGRSWLRRDLLAWKQDPGLSDLREPRPLPAECAAFWKSVDDFVSQLQEKNAQAFPE